MQFKKWVVYLLHIINLFIIMTLSNNHIMIDLCLLVIFTFNSIVLIKYNHKYLGADE